MIAFSMKRTFSILTHCPKTESCLVLCLGSTNYFHTHWTRYKNEQDKNYVAPLNYFQNSSEKKKQNFLEVIRKYEKFTKSDVRYAEFIEIALKYMDQFGVAKDLEVYKKLVDILPKGKYLPVNMIQEMFMHYPRQQNAVIGLLHQMESNAVFPDYEMQEMLLNIFGKKSRVLLKFWKMVYWMNKFAHLNPWPAPNPMPVDPREIAFLSMQKISSVDILTEVKEYWTDTLENAVDKTWIISTMSPSQRELLEVQPNDKPLVIEGPFNVWFSKESIDYFVLRGPPIKRDIVYKDTDNVDKLETPYEKLGEYKIPVTVHEDEDETYYAMCATGTSTKDSLLSWIRYLEEENPALKKIPVVFKLKSKVKEHENEQISDAKSDTTGLEEMNAKQINPGERKEHELKETET